MKHKRTPQQVMAKIEANPVRTVQDGSDRDDAGILYRYVKQLEAELTEVRSGYNDLYAKGMRLDEQLKSEMAEVSAELAEEKRLNGMGMEREAKLKSDLEAAGRDTAELAEAVKRLIDNSKEYATDTNGVTIVDKLDMARIDSLASKIGLRV